MKNHRLLFVLFFFCFAIILSSAAMAQKASPAATATGKIGAANIEIAYSSPAVKDRKIWGSLVPYDKVWRAGADEATTFTTDRDLMVEGKKLPAGTYSFFVIPTDDEWVIIFNNVASQWGAYKYNAEEDALRAEVKPVRTDKKQERLQYTIEKDGFNLIWDNLKIPVSVK